MYVGNEILDDYGAFAQTEEKREKLEECDEFGKKWLAKRSTVRLREFEMHPHALNGMVVYWLDNHEKVRSREEDQTEAVLETEAENEDEFRGQGRDNVPGKEADTTGDMKEMLRTKS